MPFNLITDAWIPVRTESGYRKRIRPAQMAADDDRIMALDWSRPDFNLACLELLTGLVYVASPPQDADDWAENCPTMDKLESALQRLVPAFNLDGDGPRFLQDFEPLEGKPVTVDHLFLDSPGHKTVKDHADIMVRPDRFSALSRASAAMALYTLQAFAPQGGSGLRTSMRGGGPLVALVNPRHDGSASLWDIVWANVPDGMALQNRDLKSAFPWLRPTHASAEGQKTFPPPGYVVPPETFFGMPRRIRLVFGSGDEQLCGFSGESDAVVVTGMIQKRHGAKYEQWIHPMTPYYRKKPGDPPLPVLAKPDRLCYRHWIGLLLKDVQGLRTRPACLTAYEERGMSDSPVLMVGGWAMNKKAPQDFVFSTQPLPLARDPDQQSRLHDLIVQLVQAGIYAQQKLQDALRQTSKQEKEEYPGGVVWLNPYRFL